MSQNLSVDQRLDLIQQLESRESARQRSAVQAAWVSVAAAALLLAMLVIGAGWRLKRMEEQRTSLAGQLTTLRSERHDLQHSVAELTERLQKAHDTVPYVNDAINKYHNGRYADAVKQYQHALSLDPTNVWIRDLMSYSQYMAGLRAQTPHERAQWFEGAVASVGQVLREDPDYTGGYVELAIYECQRDRPDAAVAAYEAARTRSQEAKHAFETRLAEIPQRCAGLRKRLLAGD